MLQSRLVFLNTLSQITGQVLGIFVSLVTFVLLARYLGADNYGQYSIITTYLGMFAIAADWSLYLLIVKGLTGESDPFKRRRLFGSHLAFRLILGLAALLLGVCLIWAFPYSAAVKLGVVVGAVAFLSNSISQLLYSIFQAELKLYITASLELLYKVLLLVSVVLVGINGWGILAVILGMVGATLLTLMLASAIARRFIALKLSDIRINSTEWREIFRSSWALGINGLFSTVVFKIDILILSLFAASSVVGLYSLSSKIVELLSILSGAFVGSVFPIITRHLASSSEKLPGVIQRSGLFLLILASFVTVITFVLAEPIVWLAGGGEFEGSIAALKILAFFPIFAFFGNYFYHLAVVFNRQNQIVWRTLTVLLINIVLNLILIPRYGYLAAAVVTIITEAVGVALSGVIIYKAFPTMVLERSAIRTIIAALITGFWLELIIARYYSFSPLLLNSQSRLAGVIAGLILLALLLYSISLMIFRVIRRDDLRQLGLSK